MRTGIARSLQSVADASCDSLAEPSASAASASFPEASGSADQLHALPGCSGALAPQWPVLPRFPSTVVRRVVA